MVTPQAGWFFMERGHGLVDATIQRVTNSVVNHAGVCIGDTVVEMLAKGATYTPVADKAASDLVWAQVPLSADQVERFVASARTLVDDHIGYSFVDLGAQLLHRVAPDLDDGELQHFITDTSHMVCSQSVDWLYNEVGVHLFTDGRWCGDVSPGDLLGVAMSNHWLVDAPEWAVYRS